MNRTTGITPETDSGLRTIRLLIGIRAVRSIGQGALVVDFSLYLHRLGWSAVEISLVLGGALLFGSVLTLIVGPLSDRAGRRRFLLAYESVQLLAALVAALSAAPLAIGLAGIVGGFGRGGNGAAGPFSPVEQAWIAQSAPAGSRGRIFSINGAAGAAGMAVGGLLATSPSWLQGVLPGALAFRPLFLLCTLSSAVCLVLISRAEDREARPARLRDAAPEAAPLPDAAEAAIRKRENGMILRLILSNMLNGSGIGMTGPLISYWFAIRFGEGPASIGSLMALGFLLSGAGLLVTGRLADRFGAVRMVVIMRLVGLAMLIAMPFAPSFWIAAGLYMFRSVFNRSTTGARSAVMAGIVRQHRRGLAASAASVSLQIPRSVGPVVTGALFEAGFLELPFVIAAVFQGAYIYMYHRSFSGAELE
ncbi:MFS transporter [Solirhodobacter olei]|uniref:MFS transporter n=1 Tax=Solirhodobacter olei TaxID=2493082 RepID=UPI000FD89E31|nr:MFS transporter [Solirhodobacter olei]